MTTANKKHPAVREAERIKELEESQKTYETTEAVLQRESSDEEREEEIEYLTKPDLLVQTIKEVQKDVAGEEDTIAAISIITATRLVDNSIPESTNLLLSDKTGLGKDHTTKRTLDVVVPPEEHLHVTKMTPESFTYWHFKEEGWTWDHKVIHFEDITQYLLNCSTFKVMSSGDNYAVVVKDQKTIEIPINGKPCMILTSHHANPRDESLRRFRIGGLNDTEKQTRRILQKISTRYTGVSKSKENLVLRKALWRLQPYPVVIPYAELIQFFFPSDSLMRTQYHCFLDYIAGSAIFHQYQREKTENGELIANPDDYMIARMVLQYTTSNPLMVPMSKEYRDICTILKDTVEPMTVRELELKCDQSLPWLYKHLPIIAATKVIIKGKRESTEANKPVTTYQYAPHENPGMIPTWQKIQDKIHDIVYKTNKTKKTKYDSLLESWFSTANIKPIKPNEESDDFDLVFYGRRIPFNGKVLLVFSVFTVFLRETKNKRYERYYKNSLPLDEKVKQAIQITIDKPDNNYDDVLDILGEKGLEKLMDDGTFFEPVLGTLRYKEV
jgi:hypothetical protein